MKFLLHDWSLLHFTAILGWIPGGVVTWLPAATGVSSPSSSSFRLSSLFSLVLVLVLWLSIPTTWGGVVAATKVFILLLLQVQQQQIHRQSPRFICCCSSEMQHMEKSNQSMQVTKEKKKKKQCCCTCRLSLTHLRKSINANPCRNCCLQGKLAFPHKVLSLLASPRVPSPSSSPNTQQDKRHFDLSPSLSYTHTPHLFCSLAAIHVSLLHVGALPVEHVRKVTFFHFLKHFLHTPRPLPQRHVGTSYARLIRQQRRHTHTHTHTNTQSCNDL